MIMIHLSCGSDLEPTLTDTDCERERATTVNGEGVARGGNASTPDGREDGVVHSGTAGVRIRDGLLVWAERE